MKRVLSKASLILKVLFGAAILAWMASSGKLNFAQVGRSLSQWPLMLGIAAGGYGQIAITTWRWKLLLKAQDIHLNFRTSWGLVMIGMLFNVVIPGAVGGDLIKGYYITRATNSRKSHAATSIVMDRVLGLIGLLFLGAVMVIIELKETLRTPATRSLGTLAVGGAVGGLAALYMALYAGNFLSRWTLLPGFARNVFSALHEYRKRASVVPVALALSVLNQAFTCAMYYMALRATGVTDMPASQFFLVVPLGLVTAAIPISPGGVGVGQAAFFALFKLAAPQYAAAGTDAFTVFQVVYLVVCLTGMYWYLSYKRLDVDAPAAKEFQA
jgi:uncharacterized membrane protein YbhN (UPF0104 family)